MEERTPRTFDTGASRDTDDGKLDFEGALNPEVLHAFVVYMASHSTMTDGSTRSADNWQKGFPEDVIVKSLLRHVMDLWRLHRGAWVERPEDGKVVDWTDALGGAMFNLQALWLSGLSEGWIV